MLIIYIEIKKNSLVGIFSDGNPFLLGYFNEKTNNNPYKI